MTITKRDGEKKSADRKRVTAVLPKCNYHLYYFPPSEVIIPTVCGLRSTGKAGRKPILGLSGFVKDRCCPSSGFLLRSSCVESTSSHVICFPAVRAPTDGLRCCFIIGSHLSPFACCSNKQAIYMHDEF